MWILRRLGTRIWARTCKFCLSVAEASSLSFRPFEEIPGPKALPFIGTLYKYLPFIGEYDFKKLHKNGVAKYAKYGPLVREEIVFGEPIVWVFRPEDIAEVFKADKTRYPERRSHRALFKYRKDRSNIYNTGGLLPTNGEDWWRLRKEFQKTLSKHQQIINFLRDTDEIVIKFIKICETNNFTDALPMLSRLFLELTCLVAFDLKINAFSQEELQPNSMSSKLIDAAFTTNSVILRLDNGPRLWRFFDTPLYRKLSKAQLYMEKVAVEIVSEKYKKLNNSGVHDNMSLLEAYLCNSALDYKDVIGMACDMLLAGIDTMTYSSAFALYHLAKNPETQRKMHLEARNLIGKKDSVLTTEILRDAMYTKAVIKETFRLNPISIGVGRILQEDIILNGFHVDKGTNIVTQNQISCRLPKYFDDPDDFIPERWFRDTGKNEKPIHPYLVLPFGHGTRSCIARRLAEQNMQILLLRICHSLKFKWNGGELDIDSFLINKPNAPINLKFYSHT